MESSSSAFSRSSGSQSSSTSCSADAIFLSLAACPRAGPLLLPATGEGDGGEAPANEGGMVREGCRYAISPQLHGRNGASITTNYSKITSTKRIEGQRIDRIELATHLIQGNDRISGGSSLRQTRLQPSAAYRRGSRGCSNPKWTAETSPTTGDVRRHSSKPYGCQLATGASGRRRRRRRRRRRTTASRR